MIITNISLLNRFRINNVVQFIFLVFSKLSVFFFVGYAIRKLGLEAYGRYSFVISFITLFIIVTDLGLNALGIREIARNNSNASKYFTLKLLTTIVPSSVVMSLIALSFILFSSQNELKILVAIASIYLLFTSISSSYSMVLSGLNRIDLVSIAENGSNAVLYLISVLALFINSNVIILVVIFSLMSFVKILILLFFAKNKIRIDTSLDKRFYIKTIKQALPILFIALLYRLYFSVDNTLLWFLKGDIAVGKYAPLMKILDAMQALPIMIMASLFPIMSSLIEKKEQSTFLFQKVQKFFFLFAAPLAVLLFIHSNNMLYMLYGVKNVDSEINCAYHLIIWTIIFLFANQFLGNFLIANNHQSFIPWVVLGCSILNISGNFLLIPRFGILGASIMTLVTEIAQYISLIFYSSIKAGFKLSGVKEFVGIIASTIILFLITKYLFDSLPLFFSLVLSAATYITFLILFSGIDKNDKKIIIQLLNFAK